MYKPTLDPFDGSDSRREALDRAVQLARESGGRVRIIYSLDEPRHVTPCDYTVEVMESARADTYAESTQALELARSEGVAAATALPSLT